MYNSDYYDQDDDYISTDFGKKTYQNKSCRLHLELHTVV